VRLNGEIRVDDDGSTTPNGICRSFPTSFSALDIVDFIFAFAVQFR
jgi:hypothetical protein